MTPAAKVLSTVKEQDGNEGDARPTAAVRRNILSDFGAGNDDSEAWIVTYMDVITLLLVFFVMMLSFADFEDQSGLSDVITPVVERATGGPTGEAETGGLANREFAETLTLSLEGHGWGDQVAVQVADDAIVVAIDARLLFASGEAQLRAAAHDLLRRIASTLTLTRILSGNRRLVTVEGHTDNVPISTPRFASNWELASARANTVVRQLIADGVPRTNLRSVGYADTQPVAPNDTAAGRAKNRRVSIVIHKPGASRRAAGDFGNPGGDGAPR